MVQDQPLLHALAAVNSMESLELYGRLGTNYELQYSTNLGAAEFMASVGGIHADEQRDKLEPGTTNSVIFYRIIQQ